MTPLLRRPAITPLFFSLLAVGSGCSGDRSEAAEVQAGPTTREDVLATINAGIAEHRATVDKALAEGPVELPSERLLRRLLPESLAGSTSATHESETREAQGKVEAKGWYLFRTDGAIENWQVELTYFGKPTLNGVSRSMMYSSGERLTLSGCPATIEHYEVLGSGTYNVNLEISPELFLTLHGASEREAALAAIEEFPIAECRRLVETGELFELDAFDKAAAQILPAKQLQELLPETFGGFQPSGSGRREDLGAAPAFSSASRSYATHQLVVTDHGDAAVTGDLPLDPSRLGALQTMSDQTEISIQTGDLSVEGGRGKWARLDSPQASWLAAEIVRGRFVFQIHGPFQKVMEPNPDLPAILAQQQAEIAEQIGSASWATIEDQWAGIAEFAENFSAPTGS